MSVCSYEDDDIPDELVCPITQEIFQDPVMDRHGRTYERKAILMWLASKGTCPLTRQPAKPSNYIPNVKMQSMVRLYQIQQDKSNNSSSSSNGMEESSSSSSAEDLEYTTYAEREKNDENRSMSLFMFDVPDDRLMEMVMLNVQNIEQQRAMNDAQRRQRPRRRRLRFFR